MGAKDRKREKEREEMREDVLWGKEEEKTRYNLYHSNQGMKQERDKKIIS